MVRKTKAEIECEQKQNADVAYYKAQHDGSREHEWLWFHTNVTVTNLIGRGAYTTEKGSFANCEDPIIRAVIVVCIETALDAAKDYYQKHPKALEDDLLE